MPANPRGPLEEPEPGRVLRFAEYALDLAAHSLTRLNGTEILLTRGEFSLLQEFVERPGRVLTRDHLLNALAGRSAEVFDRSVDMLVARLRRKIEPDPKSPRFILTAPGMGYRFAARAAPESGTAARRGEEFPRARLRRSFRTVTALLHFGHRPVTPPRHRQARK